MGLDGKPTLPRPAPHGRHCPDPAGHRAGTVAGRPYGWLLLPTGFLADVPQVCVGCLFRRGLLLSARLCGHFGAAPAECLREPCRRLYFHLPGAHPRVCLAAEPGGFGRAKRPLDAGGGDAGGVAGHPARGGGCGVGALRWPRTGRGVTPVCPLRRGVGGHGGTLPCRYGLSGAEDAAELPPFVPRAGRRRAFPLVVARGAMLRLRFPTFPFAGDAATVVGHDAFRPGLRPREPVAALYGIPSPSGRERHLQLQGHLQDPAR